MSKLTVATVLLLLLTGCALPPKSEKEYRDRMRIKGTGIIETVTSKKSLAVAKRDIQEFAAQCWNWKSTRVLGNNSGVLQSGVRTHWGNPRPGWDTFYVRDMGKAINQIPGGFYMFIADLKSSPSGGTITEFYRYDTRLYTAHIQIREILAGGEPRCPE